MVKYIFLILFILVSLLSSNAQSLCGSIVDKKGLPISSATIILKSLDSIFIEATMSNDSGIFCFVRKPPQSFNLTVQHLVYLPQSNVYHNTSEVGRIVLEENLNLLNEVVISGNRSIMKVESDGLKVSIANSVLSREVRFYDVLQKIPGIVVNNDKLEVLSLGAPIVYINGRKIRNDDDVKRLAVKDIKDIKLITSPGAEYDAEGKAVLLVTTLYPNDGFSLQTSISAKIGHKINNDDDIQFKWKKAGLTIGGNYTYKHNAPRVIQYNKYEIKNSDDTPVIYNNSNTYNKRNHHNYGIDIDYDLNQNHKVGMLYSRKSIDGNENTSSKLEYYSSKNNTTNNNPTRSNSKRKVTDNYLNAYYNGKISPRLLFNLYVDYTDNAEKLNQNVFDNEVSVLNLSKADFELYAFRALATYSEKNTRLILGTDNSWVRGENNSYITGSNIKQGTITNNENKQAVYVSYKYFSEKWNVNAGMRYEHMHSKVDDIEQPENNISKVYNNIFPSLSLSFAGESGVSQQLSYSIRTSRPSFSQLSILPIYENQYMYSKGNANLQPAKNHVINYMLSYNWFYSNIIYANINKYAGHIYYSDMQNNSVVTSYVNYDRFQQLAFVFGVEKQLFPWWYCSASLYTMKNFFNFELNGEKKHARSPFVTYNMNNSFSLPQDFMLNVDFEFSSKGDYLIETLNSTHYLNISLSRSFLNDKLDLRISASDIFRGTTQKTSGGIEMIKTNQKYSVDSRKISFDVIYRFNRFSENRKQTSASEEERMRLNHY